MLVENLLQLDEVVEGVGLVLLQAGLDAEIHLGVEVRVNVEQDLQHVVHDALIWREDLLKPDVLKQARVKIVAVNLLSRAKTLSTEKRIERLD